MVYPSFLLDIVCLPSWTIRISSNSIHTSFWKTVKEKGKWDFWVDFLWAIDHTKTQSGQIQKLELKSFLNLACFWNGDVYIKSYGDVNIAIISANKLFALFLFLKTKIFVFVFIFFVFVHKYECVQRFC